MKKIPVFDIGDTLTPAKEYSKKFFRKELEKQGVEKPPEYPFDGYNEYSIDSISSWLEKESVDADVEEMVRNYMEAKEEEMERRGVFEALRKVNQEFETLGILSDNFVVAKEFFQEMFERNGVEFDTFVVSQEIGVKKPEREIFEEFLDRRGVEGSRCVYFGNRGDIDSACRKVGMKFVFVSEHDTFGTDWGDVKIDMLTFEKIKKAIKEVENR